MATDQTVPLLNLPAELRVQIYHHILVQDPAVFIPKRMSSIRSTPIFNVCKQIRQEAEPEFWNENTFYAIAPDGSLNHILDWLNEIGKTNASRIRKLSIDYKHSRYMQIELAIRLDDRAGLLDFGGWVGEFRGHTITFHRWERDLVSRMRYMLELGLHRTSLLAVSPGTSLWPCPSLTLGPDTECVSTAMHLAFNQKIAQFKHATNVNQEEADAVVELDGWKVRMIC
jgi:hypothetical protein